MPPHQPSLARSGFSLIELLVAMAITSIIMIALISLIGQSSSVYKESRNAVESLSDARSLLHFFEAELASRLPRTPLLTQTTDGGPDILGYIRAGSFDEQLVATAGDLSTSVYYVAFSADAPNSVSPKLFRHHLDARKTQDLLEAPAPPAMPALDPANDEPLLHNVIRFEAKPKRQNAAGVYEPWTPESGGQPAVIEITIEITDDSSAARFKSQGAWLALRDGPERQSAKLIRRYSRIIPVVP
jgi:prepilin-type N-terminal cleavage/methylation domain-containing protein